MLTVLLIGMKRHDVVLIGIVSNSCFGCWGSKTRLLEPCALMVYYSESLADSSPLFVSLYPQAYDRIGARERHHRR